MIFALLPPPTNKIRWRFFHNTWIFSRMTGARFKLITIRLQTAYHEYRHIIDLQENACPHKLKIFKRFSSVKCTGDIA